MEDGFEYDKELRFSLYIDDEDRTVSAYNSQVVFDEFLSLLESDKFQYCDTNAFLNGLRRLVLLFIAESAESNDWERVCEYFCFSLREQMKEVIKVEKSRGIDEID